MPKESSPSDIDPKNADAPIADVPPKDATEDPSPSEVDETADPSPAPKDEEADPSPAKDDDKGPKSMLEAVQAAVKPSEDKAKEDPSPSEKDEEGKPESEETDPAKVEAEAKAELEKVDEDEQPPFHKHPRWQEKLAEVKALQPRAEAFDTLTGFMNTNKLSGEEMTEGLNIMALMKMNPAKALEALAPYVTALQTHLGEILPEDLAKKVEEGFMDEGSAKEMAQLRAQEAYSTQVRQEAESLTVEGAHKVMVESMTNAVSKWEENWSKTDPDYAKQLQFVRARTLELGSVAPPRTAQDAVNLAEQAKTEVKRELTAMLPKPKPIDDPTPPSGGPSREAIAAPSTYLEAVQAGLRKVAG